MNSLSVFGSYLSKQIFILKRITSFPWKSIFIFLFIISLPIAMGSQIQLSSLSSARIDLSQRTFGITFLSPSTILLFPLFFLFITQYKNIKSFKLYPFEIFLFIFLIIAEISAIFGINIQVSAIWLLKLIYGLTIYLIFSRLSLNQKQVKIIIYAFVTVIFIETLLSSMQYVKGGLLGLPIESVRRYESANQDVSDPIQGNFFFRAIGTFSHPNILTNYLALLIPVITVLLLNRSVYKTNYIFDIAFISCLITSFLSFSRWGTATVIFAIVLTVFIIKRYEKIKSFSYFSLNKISKIAILIFTLVIIGIFSNQNVQNRFLNFSLNDGSLTVRIQLIIQALSTIKDNALLGVGGGNFVTYFANYDFTKNQVSQKFLAGVHNFYLLLASETGIIGLTAFLFAMITVARVFFQKIKYLNYENKILAIGLFSSFVTYFFNGLWVMRTFEDRVGFLFWLILGLLVNLLSRKFYR